MLAVSTVASPSVLAFAPDGRLFVGEKASGAIRIVKDGVLLGPPFLDINAFVPAGTSFDTYFERGLLGIAFDPDFAENQLLYVYYTLCKVPGSGNCTRAANRIARFRAVGDSVDPASHLVILDDIGSDAGNHNGGWIGFGPIDHKLYAAVGDGGADSTKAQSLATLNGKVLRINPDGSVPSDNPHAGQAGIRGEIWASGLRNPWRCRFHPTGRLFCADVGQTTWEEINVVVPGANYGWPITEGPFDTTAHLFTHPMYWYEHQLQSAAITGGDFGVATAFPGDYQQSYFFGDFVRGWIKRAILDSSGTTVQSVEDFVTDIGTNSVTDIVAGPDGSLYYANYGANAVHRVTAVAGNRAPVALAAATPREGPSPLAVQFSSTGSHDPDGDPTTFLWDFGDGSPGSTDPAPLHTYQSPGRFTATLRVSDNRPAPATGTATVAVMVGSPPHPVIAAPLAGSTFRAGDTIALLGSATDLEDVVLPPAALHWRVILHHDTHVHPFIDDLPGSPQEFLTATTGESDPDIAYEIQLEATDSSGLTERSTVLISPLTTQFTVATDPPGMQVTLDGQPRSTPLQITGVVGFERTLGAPVQIRGGDQFTFAGWSDGGTEIHSIATPPTPTTYTATFATSCDSATAIPPDGGTLTGTTTGTSTLIGSCGSTDRSPDRVFRWTPTVSGRTMIETCSDTVTAYDTALYIRTGGCNGAPEAACNDDRPGCSTGEPSAGHGSRIDMTVTAGQTYFIVVDGYAGSRGNFALTVTRPVPCPLDVDGDGTVGVATDVVYLARHLVQLTPIPPSFRAVDPTLPEDATVAARVEAVRALLDVDRDGRVDLATDVVYIARHLLDLAPVPPTFRTTNPTIPPDATIDANVVALCPD